MYSIVFTLSGDPHQHKISLTVNNMSECYPLFCALKNVENTKGHPIIRDILVFSDEGRRILQHTMREILSNG